MSAAKLSEGIFGAVDMRLALVRAGITGPRMPRTFGDRKKRAITMAHWPRLWSAWQRYREPLRYRADGYDCEDFTRSLRNMLAELLPEAATLAVSAFYARGEFGGVEASGGSHALAFVLLEDCEWHAVEPQANGSHAPLQVGQWKAMTGAVINEITAL